MALRGKLKTSSGDEWEEGEVRTPVKKCQNGEGENDTGIERERTSRQREEATEKKRSRGRCEKDRDDLLALQGVNRQTGKRVDSQFAIEPVVAFQLVWLLARTLLIEHEPRAERTRRLSRIENIFGIYATFIGRNKENIGTKKRLDLERQSKRS